MTCISYESCRRHGKPDCEPCDHYLTEADVFGDYEPCDDAILLWVSK
jgi:hypothetical protein